MTTKKKTQDASKGKASAADLENLALMLAGVLANPATPMKLINYIHSGLDAIHNDLKDADKLTDSPEYITRLLIQHAEDSKGGAK